MKLDRVYTSTLISLAVPIIIQNFISSSLNMVDVIMIGQLGETAVAGVGLANQLFFIFILIQFGISTGSSVFSAQFWGNRDVPGIRKVLGICLAACLAIAGIFTAIALTIPGTVLRIYTADPAVAALGSSYLRMVGVSYLFTAVSISYASGLRSTGNVRLPTIASIIAWVIKIGLSYLLIFGHLGLPKMGVVGAALGTTIARAVEAAILLVFTYRQRLPLAAKLGEMLAFNRQFLKAYAKTALPVVVNETLWSLGITTYNAVYAHISTQAIAAINIASTVESMAFVIFFGFSDALAIMVGNKIGAGEIETAKTYARRTLLLTTVCAVLVGGLILLTANPVLTLYKVSADASRSAHNILIVMGFCVWVRVSNLVVFIGVLRSGGDTRYSLVLDAGSVWLIGVPSALLGAFVFHLPVHLVYLLVVSEELVKYVIGVGRMVSGKWVHNLTGAGTMSRVEAEQPAIGN